MKYWPAMVIIILAELMQKYNFPYTKPDFFFFFCQFAICSFCLWAVYQKSWTNSFLTMDSDISRFEIMNSPILKLKVCADIQMFLIVPQARDRCNSSHSLASRLFFFKVEQCFVADGLNKYLVRHFRWNRLITTASRPWLRIC